MIDLNHILLFLAVASPLILLARILYLRNARNHGWLVAATIVLLISLISWLLAPAIAGFIGGFFWALLLLLPSFADRKIDDFLLAQRLPAAANLAFIRQAVHPWKDSPYRLSLVRCLQMARAGQLDRALDLLARERSVASPAGRFASALTFALTGNWEGLVQWCRRDLRPTENPAVMSLYLRGLGEVGALEDLVHTVAALPGSSTTRLSQDNRSAFHLALTLAFAGRTAELVRLMQNQLSILPPAEQQFWLATAELTEGRRELARARFSRLRKETRDAVLRRSLDRRLSAENTLPSLSVGGESALARLLRERLPAGGSEASRAKGGSPAVWGLILLNLAMFLVEVQSGGATNSVVLRNLGALDPAAVVLRHEFWRLLTSMFLHFGVLHIAINLFGLYLLGPALERMIGAVRFVCVYLLSGLGSGLLVVLLWKVGLTQSDLLVGASGSIMGVIGVQAGLLLRHRASPFAGRQLRDIVTIVVLQTVFDLWTPQVSLAAHLGGFISGMLLGFLLSFGRRRLPGG